MSHKAITREEAGTMVDEYLAEIKEKERKKIITKALKKRKRRKASRK